MKYKSSYKSSLTFVREKEDKRAACSPRTRCAPDAVIEEVRILWWIVLNNPAHVRHVEATRRDLKGKEKQKSEV
jgi:hypothetical protein